jgi:hypothetical protein
MAFQIFKNLFKRDYREVKNVKTLEMLRPNSLIVLH